jgi:catechol 2,3-dioxygenase-like lactoylglutathione lyase family enzyme
MAIGVRGLDHVNLTVPRAVEAAAKRFYAELLGLREIAKPAASRDRGGAWFDAGAVQVHVSLEDAGPPSRRHVCFTVADLETARAAFVAAGVQVLPDDRPIPGWPRFYVLDPGGNRLEIAAPDAA